MKAARIWQILVASALFMASAPAAQAAPVVLFGDSWTALYGPALGRMLAANGIGGVGIDNNGIPGDTAANLAASGGLSMITSELAANPDVEIVHLMIGGNDMLGSWNSGMSQAQQDALLASIWADIETIVLHILAQAPGASLYLTGYDYPRPLAIGTPLEVNSFSDEAHAFGQVLLAGTPGLSMRNFSGLIQIHYGLPDLGIPPFDPSLPRIDQPSPAAGFADAIHLTAAGYDIHAQAHIDDFYAALLGPGLGVDVPAVSPPARLALVLGLLGVAVLRQRARSRASKDD